MPPAPTLCAALRFTSNRCRGRRLEQENRLSIYGDFKPPCSTCRALCVNCRRISRKRWGSRWKRN